MLYKNNEGISKITENLYLTSHNYTKDVEKLTELKIKLVINTTLLEFPHKSLRKSGIIILTVPSIDSPITPILMWTFKKGVNTALPYIHNNENVMVYCKRGVHRSVAMVCCILIGMGYTSDEGFKLVKSKRAVADPDMWYIKKRILKFEKEWKNEIKKDNDNN